MSTAITQYDAGSLTQWRDPEEVLAQAQKAAIALKKVLDLKENKVMFNNEQYLEREDWGTAGRFFGCTAKSIETRYVEFPDGNGGVTRGFEAVAIVVDMNTMHEVGRAESMCLDEEESWGEVTVYEWKDKLDANGKKIWNEKLRKGKGGYEAEKVAAGTKSKPLFQLRSMAQTRAEAKALKSVFGWFVVLAGYKPTPAEELTGHEDFDRGGREQKPPVTQPTRASEKKQETAQTTQSAAEKELEGVIEKFATGKSGDGWMTIKGEPLLVAVNKDKIDSDMKPGTFIKLRRILKKNAKFVNEQNPEGQFYELAALIELSPVQDGTVPEPDNGKLAADAAAIGEELFGDKPKGGTIVEGMVKDGTLKPASALPETKTKKPGTIGERRRIRLDSICTSQKAVNNGLTHDEMKRILAAWTQTVYKVPVEHLAEMPEDMYATFESWADGSKDWREFWKED